MHKKVKKEGFAFKYKAVYYQALKTVILLQEPSKCLAAKTSQELRLPQPESTSS